MQDEARLPELRKKLAELGMAPSEFPELGAGQDGVIAVRDLTWLTAHIAHPPNPTGLVGRCDST
jgi:hypothetical protein